MAYRDVLTVTTARAQLPRLIESTRQGKMPVIGSHRKPEAVLMHASTVWVIATLLSGFAQNEADDLIREGHTRGEPIHPGDPVGKVVAWLWTSGQHWQMTDFVGSLMAQLRHHHPDAPEPALRLADVLLGLPMALPHEFPDSEVEPLLATLREGVPRLFAKDPDSP